MLLFEKAVKSSREWHPKMVNSLNLVERFKVGGSCGHEGKVIGWVLRTLTSVGLRVKLGLLD